MSDNCLEQQRKCIVVLGGYGNFGKKIASQLIDLPIDIVIAGRNSEKAKAMVTQLALVEGQQAMLTAKQLDVTDKDFKQQLKSLRPFLTIHTSGPYQQLSQQQTEWVANACIDIGSHYIDLADNGTFIQRLTKLNAKAIESDCVVISGASTVPAISSVVVDHFASQFSVLTEIDFAIVPGNKAERGFATISGVLSYLGKPFERWQNGEWQTVYGWMDSRLLDFGAQLGKRYVANVDIPDLSLFPSRYKGVKTVKFQAGLELGWLHQSMVLMAKLAKRGYVENWQRLDKLIFASSEKLKRFGSDDGGMQIQLKGLSHQSQPLVLQWRAVALVGVGPFIPSFPSVILARKLIEGKSELNTGVYPALGLFSMVDIERYFDNFAITTEVLRQE